jgi:p-aminobenzoyl-glutamate transporter AbgT
MDTSELFSHQGTWLLILGVCFLLVALIKKTAWKEKDEKISATSYLMGGVIAILAYFFT